MEWIHFQRSSSDPGNFMQGEWLSAIRWQLENAIKALKIIPQGSMTAFADLDIVWMPGAFTELSQTCSDGIWAMCEDEQANLNAGLIVGRNTSELMWLLHHCLAYMHSHPGAHDQDALRAVAKDRVQVLPPCFANTKTQRLVPIPKVLCFHAICTMADGVRGSVEQKAQMLNGWLSVSDNIASLTNSKTRESGKCTRLTT